MHPFLVDFGTHDLPLLGWSRLALPTYGALFATGALLAWWWFLRRARAMGLEAERVFNLAFYTLIGGILGAKALLILVDAPYYLANPTAILGSLRTAGVLMGGVAAGALVFILYCRRHALPLHRLGDAIAAPLALAQGIGRLGCLAAGCCYGRPTTSSWCAVSFTDRAAQDQTGVPLGVPLVPTQLLQALADLALAGLLTVLWRRRPRAAGTVFYTYMIVYGASRATIEHWRGDAARGLWLGNAVSTSQILSIVAVVAGIVLLVLARRGVRGATEAGPS